MTKTTKTKNPLRQLASAITIECQADGAKGVKQTTVLKTLTEHAGFRSIQSSDHVFKQTPPQPTLSAGQIFLTGLLYSSYPSADLLPISFEDVAKPHLSCENVGDSLFAFLHATLVAQPEMFTQKLAGYLTQIDTIQSAMEHGTFEDPCVQAVFTKAGLPLDLAHFISVEMNEVAEGLEGRERQDEQVRAMERVSLDIDAVQNEFLCSRHIINLILPS